MLCFELGVPEGKCEEKFRERLRNPATYSRKHGVNMPGLWKPGPAFPLEVLASMFIASLELH